MIMRILKAAGVLFAIPVAIALFVCAVSVLTLGLGLVLAPAVGIFLLPCH